MRVPQAVIFGEPNRGRPKRKSNLYGAPLKSIVPMAEKHDLNPKLLVEAFVESWRKKTSQCGSLTIRCRLMNQDSAIFLVTHEGKAVSQFPIKLEALEDPNSFKSCLENIPIPNYTKNETEQKQKKIGDLRYGMKRIDLKAKIIEVPPMKAVLTRFGTQSYVSNVVVADETGSIRLCLWNEQINKVHVGDGVEIENSYVASFAGEPQLRIGRKGMISVINHSPSS